MTHDRNNPKKPAKGNRFTVRTARELYSNKSDYLKAIGRQLTPDVWETIVSRAIHDAAFGRPHIRAKAREWFAKYLLPFNEEVELHKENRSDYDFLVQVYKIFEQGIQTNKDVEEALAIAFGSLLPKERATLRSVLAQADSEDTQAFWDETHKRAIEKEERERQSKSGVFIYKPGEAGAGKVAG